MEPTIRWFNQSMRAARGIAGTLVTSALAATADLALRAPKSGNDPGCVKTRLSQERAELFSQLPSPKRSRRCNRLSTTTKLRQKFYAQLQRRCFHIAWTHLRHRPSRDWLPNCFGLRGQPRGPHHSNLISAAPSMTRGLFPETKRASRVWLRRLITKGIAGILGRGGCRTNAADAGGCGPACLHARITATVSRLRAIRNAIVVSVNGRRRHHEKR